MSVSIESLFQFAVSKIGWLLFHSLWQIALIALLFVIARAIIQAASSPSPAKTSARIYVVGCIALALMVIAPLVTLLLQQDTTRTAIKDTTMFPELVEPFVFGSSESRFLELPNPEITPDEMAAVKAMPETPELGWTTAAATRIETSLLNLGISWRSIQPWVVAAWLVGVCLFSFRPLFGAREIRHLRQSMSTDLPESLAGLAVKLTDELSVSNSVQFASSKLASVPLVIGYFKPVVLLPFSMMTELSTQQIELIIRHELAHVRRHDVFVNLFQIGVESMFFFHPCMWFVSKVVHQERENCCDDVAIENGNVKQYANALVAVEQSRQPSLAMASTGGQLLPRIERMLNLGPKRRSNSWIEGAVPITMLVGFMLVFGLQSAFAATPQEEVVKHRLIKHNFSKTKLGKSLELELKKLDQVGFTGSILVAHNGEIILATSEGFNDEKTKSEITPKSLFEIASITKSFTSTAAMILAEKGKLDLDASIAVYLPNVPESSKSITVRQLMSHQSGIPADRYGNAYGGLEVAVQTMLANGPVNKPGTKFEYWNQGYILLSEIIAKAAGKPFVDVVRESIFEPANMQGSCFNGDDLPDEFVLTVGNGSIGAPRTCLEHPYGSYGLQYRGTGGLVSNVFDMWKFHHALQHKKLLSKESLAAFVDVGIGDNAKPYGLGWFVRDLQNGDPCISHGGKVRGFNGEFRRYPKTDSCIVVLCSRDDGPSTMVAGMIEGILFPPDPKTVLSERDVAAFLGTYHSQTGRELVISDVNGKATYNVKWVPSNPNGPVSRGYVQRNDKGKLIFFQSNDVTEIKAKYSDDKSKVNKIHYSKDIYVRDVNANAAADDPFARLNLLEKLKTGEAKKFVGTYKAGFGPALKIERTAGNLIFEMTMEADQTKQPLVGYLRKNKDSVYILFHPTSPLTIEFELSEDQKSVVEIKATELNMVFKRDE